MKSFIALALFVAAASAASLDSKDAVVLRYDNNNIGVEGYAYAVETSDGKLAEETASLKNVGTENEALQVQGRFAYVGPDGVTYTVTYTADEQGFRPVGAHLPQAPVV